MSEKVKIMQNKPRVVAAVEIDEGNQSVIYTKIDPDVVARIGRIEAMLERLLRDHSPEEPF